jgi:hypothetical protein
VANLLDVLEEELSEALVVPNAAEDICPDCYRFANQHKFATRDKTVATKATSDSDSESDSDDEEEEERKEGDKPDNQERELQQQQQNEALIIKAAIHVKMAQKQRLFYQEKRQEAIDTVNNRPSERVLCYVGDYAQNLCVPNFASEQPGDTYYFSPMSCYCFGMVDCSTTRLAAMLYTEDVAKKGGNNVASLVWANLKRLGIMDAVEPIKELNIVMDNCGGQNKNRMVLRMLHYLVKKKVAVDARIIFLVKGHTKNDADRLFNLMKKEYRKSNVYIPSDLHDCIQHELIDTVVVAADTFKDWDTQEDTIIDRTKNITPHHCFLVSANRDNGNTMYMEPYVDSGDEISRRLVKPIARDDAFWLTLEEPPSIPPVEILDIKWVELYDKWGKFIPLDKKTEWRYYHEDPGPVRRKAIKSNTKAAKLARKGRTRTNDASEVKQKKAKDDAIEDAAQSTGAI